MGSDLVLETIGAEPSDLESELLHAR